MKNKSIKLLMLFSLLAVVLLGRCYSVKADDNPGTDGEIGTEDGIIDLIEEEDIEYEAALLERINCKSGNKLSIKDGEIIYINEGLVFESYEENALIEGDNANEHYYYSISYDSGETFDEYFEMESPVYEMSPAVDNDEIIIQFKKKYDLVKVSETEEEITDSETDDNDSECTKTIKTITKHISHVTLTSRAYHVIFDTKEPDIFEQSEVRWDEWVNYNRNADFVFEDDVSKISRAVVTLNGDILFEYHLENGIEAEKSVNASITLDREAVDDNGQLIKIIAQDCAGNKSEKEYRYFLDKTRPELLFQGPVDESISPSDVMLLFSGTDNIISQTSLFYKIEQVKRGERRIIADESICVENGEISKSSFITEDGEYAIWAVVRDKAGNSSDELVSSFRLDKTSPVVSIEGFEKGLDYKTEAVARVKISDMFYKDLNTKIRVLRKWPGGSEIFLEEALTPDREEYLRNINLYMDGDYEISVSAIDAADNAAFESSYVRVDKTAPDLSIGGKTDQKAQKDTPCFMISTHELFYDEAKVSVLLYKKMNSGLFSEPSVYTYTMSGDYSEFAFPIVEEGEYMLLIKAFDRTGNEKCETVEFIYDCSAPVIGWIGGLNKKYIKSFTLPRLLGNIISDRTPVSYKAYLNANNIKEGDVFTGDGKYVLRIIATDEAGNISDETAEFIIDNTPPKIIAKGIKSNGEVKTGSVVELTLYDASDHFEKCLYNGEEIDIKEDGSKCIISIEGDGEQELEVRATDEAGNITEKTFMVSASVFAMPSKVANAVKSLADTKTLNDKNSSVKIDKNFNEKYLYFFIPVFMGVLGISTLKILNRR